MFTIAEAAAVLDCNPGVIRSQVDRREGLLFGSVRRDQLSADDVLAMGLLRQVQAALGEKSPAAKRVVRDYLPFTRGVLDDEGRTLPSGIVIPAGEGVSVKLDVSSLPDVLRLRIKQLRANELSVLIDRKPALREVTA